MKTLLIAFILILGVYAQAQHTVTLTSGRIISGKILSVNDKEIIIEQDSITKYSCPLPQVSNYYDGTVVRKPNGDISKKYNERYATAGDEFKKGSTLFYAGAGITCAGLATALIVPRFYQLDIDDTEDVVKWKTDLVKTLTLAGGAAACVGILIQISGVTHFAIAGSKLNATVNGNGVGLSMNF